MGKINGSASIEIEAPIDEVYAAAADVEASPRWQPEIKVAECIERDGEGNQVLVHMETDAKVRTARLGDPLQLRGAEPDLLGAGGRRPEVGRGQLGARGPRRRADPRHLLARGRPRAARSGLLIRGPLSACSAASWSTACPRS